MTPKSSIPAALLTLVAAACSSSSDTAPRQAATAGGQCPADAGAGATAPTGDVVKIPGGEAGIGFDDLMYSARLHRMLVPGGWTGKVHLIDPDTLGVTSIDGFSKEPSWKAGDDTKGAGTLVEGNGFVFVGDRTTHELGVVDPAAKKVLKKVQLLDYPDYVRYVEATGEVWVGEPYAGQIEVLKGANDGNPVSDGVISLMAGGLAPEALVIDQQRGWALTMRLFKGEVIAIDVRTRQVVGTWPTECGSAGSHGIVAVDERRGFVFPGCLNKAYVEVLDLNHDGAKLDSFDLHSNVTTATMVAFSSTLNHFYMRGDPGTPLTFFGVGNAGKLEHLLTFDMTFGAPPQTKAHCLAADDVGGVWSCDWYAGTILRYQDALPSCTLP